MEPAILQSKFRGSLLGVLIGDCCGAPYEGEIIETSGDRLVLHKYFDKLEGPFFKAPVKPYTDDTAMTMCVTKCLIDYKDVPHKELAGNLMREYFKDPNRGYGNSVATIFIKLRKNKLEDPLRPADEQFNGLGSYGNGSAMRIAPIGLFCHNKSMDKLIELTKECSVITHTHHLGIRGAILQALAVNLCVRANPKEFDKNAFLNSILGKMKEVEEEDKESSGLEVDNSYQRQLGLVEKLLKNVQSDEEVINNLGHSVSALYSVPTALFVFLRALENIEGIQTDNQFRRALEYAISLGGDTDAIASMAGALMGALYGDTIIAESLIKHCEASSEIISLANNLYEASTV